MSQVSSVVVVVVSIFLIVRSCLLINMNKRLKGLSDHTFNVFFQRLGNTKSKQFWPLYQIKHSNILLHIYSIKHTIVKLNCWLMTLT